MRSLMLQHYDTAHTHVEKLLLHRALPKHAARLVPNITSQPEEAYQYASSATSTQNEYTKQNHTKGDQ